MRPLAPYFSHLTLFAEGGTLVDMLWAPPSGQTPDSWTPADPLLIKQTNLGACQYETVVWNSVVRLWYILLYHLRWWAAPGSTKSFQWFTHGIIHKRSGGASGEECSEKLQLLAQALIWWCGIVGGALWSVCGALMLEGYLFWWNKVSKVYEWRHLGMENMLLIKIGQKWGVTDCTPTV